MESKQAVPKWDIATGIEDGPFIFDLPMMDGRNPATVDRWFIPISIGRPPSKVMQSFFHPQHVSLPNNAPPGGAKGIDWALLPTGCFFSIPVKKVDTSGSNRSQPSSCFFLGVQVCQPMGSYWHIHIDVQYCEYYGPLISTYDISQFS